MITFRTLKTVSDVHQGQIVQVKFYGDFSQNAKNVQAVSCDVHGVVYLLRYFDNILTYNCNKQCFWKSRLNGPAYVISPLFFDNCGADPVVEEDDMQQATNPYKDQQIEEKPKPAFLIAFGALERVILTTVHPNPSELVAIERPDYIEA